MSMIETLVAQGEQLAATGQLAQAKDRYLQICQIAPHRSRFWFRLAELQYDLEQFADALRALEYALRLEPTNASALLLASAALLETGGYQQAVQLADQALKSDENQRLAALSNKSIALLRLGRYQEVLATVDAVLALDETQPTAHSTQGSALFSLGHYEAALDAFDRALALRPEHSGTLINRAATLRVLQRWEEALAAVDAALTMQPDSPPGLLNRAAILLDLQRYEDALASLDRLLHQQPSHAKALANRTLALLRLGRLQEALAMMQSLRATGQSVAEWVLTASELLLRRAQPLQALSWIEQGLVWHPDHPELLRGQIAILLMQERYLAALPVAEKLRQLTEPTQTPARLAVAAAFNANGRFAESLVLLNELPAAAIDNDWQFHAKRGEALAGLDRFNESRQSFETAERLSSRAFRASYHDGPFQSRPDDSEPPPVTPELARINFELRRLEHGDWQDYENRVAAIQHWTEAALARGEPSPLLPFRSLFLPLPQSLRFTIARREAERLAAVGHSDRAIGAGTTPSPVKPARLKIGYVSADFREHPTAHLMRGLFGCHDRDRFEVFGYSLRGDDGSGYYRQIKADCDRFVDLSAVDNAAAAQQIRADGIDLLIDLMTYTNYARPEIFALRPAPVQVGWLGFPGSSGARYLDYLLVDSVVLPSEQIGFCTEQPIYLPECYQINDRWQEIAETGCRRSDHGLPEQGFVFCCFNQMQKLEPVMFAVWMRILKRVTDSVLWLYCSSEEAQGRLRAMAVAHGIAAERLIFAGHLPKPHHLERHRLADLFLDTRLYNAHTTASDALWAGLPVLTCLGETFPARVAASLLQAVGLPELIVATMPAYEELAVRLAAAPAELAGLRAKLADNRLRMPLFDTERFVRHLERAYQLMNERQTRGLEPTLLRVEALPVSG